MTSQELNATFLILGFLSGVIAGLLSAVLLHLKCEAPRPHGPDPDCAIGSDRSRGPLGID